MGWNLPQTFVPLAPGSGGGPRRSGDVSLQVNRVCVILLHKIKYVMD